MQTNEEYNTDVVAMNLHNQTYDDDSADFMSQASSYTVYKIGWYFHFYPSFQFVWTAD